MEKDRRNAIIAGACLLGMALAVLTTGIACSAATYRAQTAETPHVQVIDVDEPDVEEPDTPETPDEPETPDTPEEPVDPEDPHTEDPEDPADPEEPGTENPDDPAEPSEPDAPETPDEPGEPEDPQPEEPGEPEDPEVEVPEIDSTKTYTVFELVDMFKEFHEELNGSFVKIKVRVAGQAAGARGCCWFQDTNDEAIERSSQITQDRMINMIARPDDGDNNDYYYKIQGKITTISGTVTYEHSTFFGVDCLFIR